MGEFYKHLKCDQLFSSSISVWKFVKEAVVFMATIFMRTFGMQLLVKNSNLKESLIYTEAISMQSPLRDGIITGHLPCITSQLPFPKNRK